MDNTSHRNNRGRTIPVTGTTSSTEDGQHQSQEQQRTDNTSHRDNQQYRGWTTPVTGTTEHRQHQSQGQPAVQRMDNTSHRNNRGQTKPITRTTSSTEDGQYQLQGQPATGTCCITANNRTSQRIKYRAEDWQNQSQKELCESQAIHLNVKTRPLNLNDR